MDKITKKKELEEKIEALKKKVGKLEQIVDQGVARTREMQKKYGVKKKEPAK